MLKVIFRKTSEGLLNYWFYRRQGINVVFFALSRSSARSTLPLKEDPRKPREEEETKRPQGSPSVEPFPKSISNIPGNKKPTQVRDR